ncbi:hypothetical protein J6590_103366, partial [Homalodisca vitripennis]
LIVETWATWCEFKVTTRGYSSRCRLLQNRAGVERRILLTGRQLMVSWEEGWGSSNCGDVGYMVRVQGHYSRLHRCGEEDLVNWTSWQVEEICQQLMVSWEEGWGSSNCVDVGYMLALACGAHGYGWSVFCRVTGRYFTSSWVVVDALVNLDLEYIARDNVAMVGRVDSINVEALVYLPLTASNLFFPALRMETSVTPPCFGIVSKTSQCTQISDVHGEKGELELNSTHIVIEL